MVNLNPPAYFKKNLSNYLKYVKSENSADIICYKPTLLVSL